MCKLPIKKRLKILYQFAIKAYALLLFLASFFHPKARLWVVGRKDIFSKLKLAFLSNQSDVAWFHCASLGEFEQARPLIEAFKIEFSEYKILLTFFSPSGYEVRKNYPLADWIFYLPIDTPTNAAQFVGMVKPKVVFFTKYEFWYYYLSALRKSGALIISFSTIFQPRQVFFKWYGGFYLRFLTFFDKLFVQNESSLKLLLAHGVKTGAIAGDTRFDRVAALAKDIKPIPLVEQFKRNHPLLILGSTWPVDIAMLLPSLLLQADLKIVIAPHEISEQNFVQIEAVCKSKSLRFSAANMSNINAAQVLIIDNMGMLSALYQYADYAYIGGGFGKGIHNTLEAATFGIPIFIGPKYNKFQEAIDLVALQCAFAVANAKQFNTHFASILTIETKQKIAIKARHYVQQQLGATEQIIQYCKQQLL
jgi:3-deoxy-D-manno-octulosonic-acid transferase